MASALGTCRKGMPLLVHQFIVCRGALALPAISHKREASTDMLSSYKRGRGGRSSFSGNVVTVFGASGYLGRYVLNKLGKSGCQIIIPYRCDPYDVQRLKLCGDLGQILFQPFDLRDEESIRRSMKYSNVVINLIGRDFETKNFKFDDVHVKGARLIAKCAAESNVQKLIHFSHLNASPKPQSIYLKGGSKYLKSKYAGEVAVREEFPESIIFRPSDMFGSEDRFLLYYARWWRRLGRTFPLYKKGTQTIKQPVFVSNVAEGVINAMNDPTTFGKTFDAVGPNRYYLSDLIDFFIKILRNPDIKRSRMNPFFLVKMAIHSFAPNDPHLHMEKLELESISDVVSGNPTLDDLGVKLLPIEDRAPFELKPYRFFAYYQDKLGEFPDPSPPPIIH